MKFEPVVKTLKNGEEIVLCYPTVDDAQGCADHANVVFAETPNLVNGPEDGLLTAEQEVAWISKFLEAERDVIVIAKHNGKIIGLANLSARSSKARVQHRSSFGISVQKAYWSVGVGSALLEQIIKLAKQIGFEQIELTVMKGNDKAQSLYKKFGFVETGVIPNALKYADGTYSDSISMVNML